MFAFCSCVFLVNYEMKNINKDKTRHTAGTSEIYTWAVVLYTIWHSADLAAGCGTSRWFIMKPFSCVWCVQCTQPIQDSNRGTTVCKLCREWRMLLCCVLCVCVCRGSRPSCVEGPEGFLSYALCGYYRRIICKWYRGAELLLEYCLWPLHCFTSPQDPQPLQRT